MILRNTQYLSNYVPPGNHSCSIDPPSILQGQAAASRFPRLYGCPSGNLREWNMASIGTRTGNLRMKSRFSPLNCRTWNRWRMFNARTPGFIYQMAYLKHLLKLGCLGRVTVFIFEPSVFFFKHIMCLINDTVLGVLAAKCRRFRISLFRAWRYMQLAGHTARTHTHTHTRTLTCNMMCHVSIKYIYIYVCVW